MRVTENMRLLAQQQSLRSSSAHLYELSNKAAKGQVVSRPSDDPAAYSSIVRRGDKIARLKSRHEAVGRAAADLQVAEGALASASDLLAQAREIAVQMADGSYGASDRAVAANEVTGIRQQLVAIANTKGARGYMFGGTITNPEPFPAGVFGGNDRMVQTEYADGQLADSSVSGQSAFTALNGGVDVFALLAQLATDLANDNQAGVQTAISLVDQGHQQVTQVRAQAGVLIRRFESADDVTSSALTVAMTQQGDEQQGDMTSILVELQEAENAYQRSIAVTRQVLAMASSLQRF